MIHAFANRSFRHVTNRTVVHAFAAAPVAADPFQPALLVVTKRIPPSDREEFEYWQEDGFKVVRNLVGESNVHCDHFSPLSHERPGVDRLDVVESDTIVLAFSSRDHLDTWRGSKERKEWLEQGAHLNRRAAAAVVDFDDDSFGGFLPYSQSPTPPSKLKISSVILMAIYPIVGGIGHGIMPLVRDVYPAYATLPHSVQLFVQCSLTVGFMVNVLPHVQKAMAFHTGPEASSATYVVPLSAYVAMICGAELAMTHTLPFAT